MTEREHKPKAAPLWIDAQTHAAALGLRRSCIVRPAADAEGHEAPADSVRALCVTLLQWPSVFRDLPARAALTLTHRASGLGLGGVGGPYPATPVGLRRAQAAAAALLALPGWDWAASDPVPAALQVATAAADALQAALGELGEARALTLAERRKALPEVEEGPAEALRRPGGEWVPCEVVDRRPTDTRAKPGWYRVRFTNPPGVDLLPPEQVRAVR